MAGRIPSERVHDTFRHKDAGKVQISTNSKCATDDFHIDRSRLGTHEHYDHEAPNEWGGTGKFVPKHNSIMDNVRGAMGGIGARSSSKCVHEDHDCCHEDGRPSFAPHSHHGHDHPNPLTRKRGD